MSEHPHSDRPYTNRLESLSDEFEDAIHDGKSLEEAVEDYRNDRGYGDGGWGEYLATKVEQLALSYTFHVTARWLHEDGRFEALCTQLEAERKEGAPRDTTGHFPRKVPDVLRHPGD